jgi:uncharacterized membrane protein YczE
MVMNCDMSRHWDDSLCKQIRIFVRIFEITERTKDVGVMDISIFLKKIILLFLGLYLMSIGVVFSVNAGLGVSPASCIPYICNLAFPVSLGQATIALNVVLILSQIALLRKKYKPVQLIQLPVSILFGFLIDLNADLFQSIVAHSYMGGVLLCLLSCFLVGGSVFLIVKANLTFLPGEGLALVISQISHVDFGKAKIGTDSSFVLIALIGSFLFLSTLQGIGEGTIIAAFLVGLTVKALNRITPFIERLVKLETARC